jgi:uncharacterized membrane protein
MVAGGIRGANGRPSSRRDRCPDDRQVALVVIMTRSLFIVAALAAALLARSAGGQATFQGLGFPPGPNQFSLGRAVSGDGTIVAGVGGATAAWTWTSTGGFVPLPLLPGYTSADVWGISDNGLIVVGHQSGGGQAVACKWVGGVVTSLGTLPGGGHADAYDVSNNGLVIVGDSTATQCDPFESFPQPFRTTNGFTLIQMGNLVTNCGYGRARAVNPGGAVIVGVSGENPQDAQAFRRVAPNAMVGLGFLPGASPPRSAAHAVSADGSVVAGDGTNASGVLVPARWTSGTGWEALAPLPAGLGNTSAVAISGDGLVIVGNGHYATPCCDVFPFIWTAQMGMRDLREYLFNVHGLYLDEWTDIHVEDVSFDGRTIVGYGWHNGIEEWEAWVVTLPPYDDTDLDGLPDDWEINGVPYIDIDGLEQRYVLDGPDPGAQSDADPLHKDLFVELDMMSTLTFPADSIDAVVTVFDQAPLDNPDGSTGITLHLIVDDANLPPEWVTQTPDFAWPASAPQLRANWFGTSAERADPSSAPLLDAKSRAYRYCIQMYMASTKHGGQAEISGDDMVIYSGAYTALSKAAIFMHELGHCLGLRHGGGDDINGKPNYLSIMNYMLTYKRTWSETIWRLDFSREALPTLDEGSLNEQSSIGSQFYYNFFMPFYNIVPAGAECHEDLLWGEPLVSYVSIEPGSTTDYSLDCDENDVGVEADLNYLDGSGLPGTVSPSPGEVLESWNDWANIVLAVSDGGGAFAGAAPPDEVTEDQLAFMEENFPIPPGACSGDIAPIGARDGVVNVSDMLALLTSWGDCVNIADCPADLAPGVGDGSVSVSDLLELLSAWGLCPSR